MNVNRSALLVATFLFFGSCQGQENNLQLLNLQKEIQLPGVKGRIDHIDIDLKEQVAYVAALGNNTLEVVDLKNGIVTGTITGLQTYIRGLQRLSGRDSREITELGKLHNKPLKGQKNNIVYEPGHAQEVQMLTPELPWE